VYPESVASTEQMFEAAVEAGAENVETLKGNHEITTAMEDYIAVKEALAEKFGEPESNGIVWKPKTLTALNQEQAESLFTMIETMEDSDDVQNVFANFDIADDVMERLMAS